MQRSYPRPCYYKVVRPSSYFHHVGRLFIFWPHACLLQTANTKANVQKIKDNVSEKIKSIDRGALLEALSRTDLCTNLHSYDLDGLVNEYNNTLKVALDCHAPIITKTATKRPSVPWFNDEVKFAKKEKRRAERKWRRTKLHSDLIDFKAKKNIATCVMKRARTTYYTDLIQGNSDDSRKLFKCAKSLFNQEADLTSPGYHDKTKTSQWHRAVFLHRRLSAFARHLI